MIHINAFFKGIPKLKQIFILVSRIKILKVNFVKLINLKLKIQA